MNVRKLLRKMIARHAWLTGPIWKGLYPLFRREERWSGDEYSADRVEAFSTIFRENRWGDGESVSGSGSTVTGTRLLKSSLDKAFRRTGGSSLLDAPCGDFNWMQHIPLPGAYIGGEIVADLVRQLTEKFSGPGRRFQVLDIVQDTLPAADLWLCRHVLMHLSNADVLATLKNFAGSAIPFVLIDNYDFVRDNRDIRSGGYRYINLRRAPFNLPRPLATYANSLPPEAPDSLALWSREQIAAALAKNAPKAPAH